ncbi:MAG: hypothetical protein R2911_22545 [Caldilineaceae bacterium]
MENVAPIFCFLLLGIIFIGGPLFYRTMKYGSFKGALFNTHVGERLGSVPARGSQTTNITFNVYATQTDQGEKRIGLELSAKGLASFQIIPATLSIADAKRLVALLEAAITNN